PVFKYNEYKWRKRIEPMQYEEAKRVLVEANEEVASVAVDRFFSLLIAQIEKEISLKNQSNYDTLYRIAKGRYQLGKIAENDLLQLELNLLQANAAMEDAELNYETRLSAFKSYLRLKGDHPVILIPPGETNHFVVSADKAIEEAKNNSSDGLAFQRRLIEAESEVNRAKMLGRFDADIYAVLGLTQTSDILRDAYKNPLDEERVTVGITVPILDWGLAHGRIKLAESKQDLEAASVEQERVDYVQNIFVNVMQFNMQKNQLRIAAKSDTVAQKRYDVTQKRYMIGKINDVLDLNLAQIDNDNAKIGYYRSLMTYWKSYYLIRKITLYDFEHNTPIMVSFDDLIR
ncbi:MAG: TolC family protein, partial [Bacteroidetes bacterium]|nr:TolC family protein [Bacteroidota bacterium]